MIRHSVLEILERKKGAVVTGGQLANALGVSRTAVWKAIHQLQSGGAKIISVPNVGYKLLPEDDALSSSAIESGLSTAFVGRQLTILQTTSSTNEHLKSLDSEALLSGHVIVSDEQTGGRGRRGRRFLSPKGAGAYLSILLKVEPGGPDIRFLTILASVAVSRAIEVVAPVEARIKWVNDVFVSGKKICGILTEGILSAELQELSSVIVGIGINTAPVPDEIGDIATSIEQQSGLSGIRNRLIAEVLNQFESAYLDYVERGQRAAIANEYDRRLFIKGRRVRVSTASSDYEATVLGIGEDGALIVKTDDNTKIITTGEIHLL